MITAMTATAILVVTLLILASAAFVAYAVATLKGDGPRTGRRQPPASHPRDMFDPRTGRLA